MTGPGDPPRQVAPAAARPGLRLVPPPGPVRLDPAATDVIEAAVRRAEAHLALPAGRRGLFPGATPDAVRRRWVELRSVADPTPLERRADAVRLAADTVRRQHIDTAEDLGPLWDRWAGPEAEAVQRRMSSLARSADALVGELTATADGLDDAARVVVAAVHDLAARADALLRAFDEASLRGFLAALSSARETCARAGAAPRCP